MVTDIDSTTLGDETSDSERGSPLVSGLLGYRIAVGHFTENFLRKPHVKCHEKYVTETFCGSLKIEILLYLAFIVSELHVY